MSNDVSPAGARPASLASSQAYEPPHIQETNGSKTSPNMNAVGATDTSLEQQQFNVRTDKATAENKLTQKMISKND